MSKTLHDRTIALAALLQSVSIVDHYAKHGSSGCSADELLLPSLFEFNPRSTLSIYGSRHNLQPGLRLLLQAIEQPQKVNALGYAVVLLKLASKVEDNESCLLTISSGLKEAKSKLVYFDNDYEQIFSSVADLYTQTISKLSPRVMVKGDENLLRQEKITSKIRVHLLCGIRAAILWRQCGGRQWELILKRKRISQEALQLLNSSHLGSEHDS